MYTYNMLHMLVDHRYWPYFDYPAFQREIAQHADNWCSDWTTLERLAQEENERQEAASEFCWVSWQEFPAKQLPAGGATFPTTWLLWVGEPAASCCFGKAGGWPTTF